MAMNKEQSRLGVGIKLPAWNLSALCAAAASPLILMPVGIQKAEGRSQRLPPASLPMVRSQLDQIAQTQSGLLPSALMDQAALLFGKADYSAAIALWTQVILARPDISLVNEALINRSKAYLVIGQPALALADLEACRYQLKDVGALADLWLLKGSAYLQNKQYSEAIAAFGQSERLRPGNPILYSNRSVAYQSVGKIAEAKADIASAIKLQPSFSSYFNLAVLERLSGNHRACYGLLSQMIGQSQPYVQLFVQRGLCAAEMGSHDAAIADMLKALKLDPNNVEAIQQLGLSLAAKNQKESARQYLLKAASIRLANGQVDYYQKLLTQIAALDRL